MSASKTITALTFLMMGITGSSIAAADQYHYENMLVGDRAAGLGGAYVGVSDDPSGLYYNPAGIVYSSNNSVSASSNAYRRTVSEYKSVLGNKGSWNRSSSSLLPNFFGVTQKFGSGYLGFSFAVTDSILEDQDQHFSNLTLGSGGGAVAIDDYFINFNNQDNTFRFGPSYALRLSDRLSLGMTLYSYYRKQELILNQQIYYTAGNTLWTNQYFEITESGIEPIIGMMWTPAERLSVGLSMRQVMLYYSGARAQVTQYPSASPTMPAPVLSTSTEKRDLPLNTRLGVAWFASQNLLLASDIAHYSAAGNRISIMNYSLGGEYYFSPAWATRFGLYTDNSNTPELAAGKTSQLEHVDLTGLSLSLSRFTRSSSLTLGINTVSGSGEAQVLSGTTDTQDLSIAGLTIYISASYSY